MRPLLRPVLAATVTAGLVLTAATVPARASVSTGSEPWAARAADAYQALQTNLYQGADDNGLYLEQTPRQAADPQYSYLWPMREAAAAAVDMQQLPGAGSAYREDAGERFGTLELYHVGGERPGYASYLPPPLGSGGDLFYDDNAVVGLSQLDQYELTGDTALLRRAEAILPVLDRAWDSDPAKACPGGMDWFDAPSNNIRATNVTALSAQFAARLFLHTGDAGALEQAEKWYGWVYSCMRQAPGLYVNDRGDDGTVNRTLWTYNSGAMIGTATALFQGTGETAYLDRAVEDAQGSLAHWTQEERLHDQPAIFNSFYFKDLLALDAVRPDAGYLQVIAGYADSTYRTNRDPATGLFRFQPSGGGDYAPQAPAATLHQAAMVQIFATLAEAEAEAGAGAEAAAEAGVRRS